MPTEIWAIALVVVATLVGASGPVLLKKASSQVKISFRAIVKNYNLIGGFALYGLATILFIPALRGGELSVLYPIVSITYIWVSLLSMWFLKEKMNLWKWFGIVFIIIGVAFISMRGA